LVVGVSETDGRGAKLSAISAFSFCSSPSCFCLSLVNAAVACFFFKIPGDVLFLVCFSPLLSSGVDFYGNIK